MKHDLIINDNRGTVRISVTLETFGWERADRSGNQFRYDVTIFHKAPTKRKELINPDIANEKEIYAAKMELWNLIKP